MTRMKRLMGISFVTLVGLAAPAWAGFGACLLNHGIYCICPPPPDCPDCCPPCESRLFHFCSCRKAEHAQELISELSSCECCERIRAAKKLGSRLHADFCCNPEVLSALAHALACDPCWEVRSAAAWGIAYQGARVDEGVLGLYLASKLDPHYMVRDAATDALGVLLVCRRDCFTDLFARADAWAAKNKGRYKPGTPGCVTAAVEILGGTIVPATPPPPPAKTAAAIRQLPHQSGLYEHGQVMMTPVGR
jgi:hypothetical protein